MRRKSAEHGRNPDVWFDPVEQEVIETGNHETPQYVISILKYHIAYKLLTEQSKRDYELSSQLH